MLLQILNDLINLDVKTLIAILFWGNFTSVILVYSYQIFNHNAKEQKLVKYLFLAKLFQTFAYLFIFYRGTLSNFFSINIGNSFLLIGFYLEALSMLEIIRADNKRLQQLLRFILYTTLVIFNILEIANPDSALRVSIASVCVFSILVIPNLKLLLTKRMGKFKRLIGVYYLFFISLLLPRAVYTVVTKDVNIFSNFMIQSLTFLALVLLMVFSLSAYLLLMKETADKTIKSMATTDCLTGLSNRYSFMEAAEDAFTLHKHEAVQLSILYLDIDYFKKVNDNYGHSFGDEVLTRFGQIINTNLRAWDLSCRYGGEEFVVLLSHTNSYTGQVVAKRIMSEVDSATFASQPDFKFTVSIGIVNGTPEYSDHISKFIDQADRALYEAKNTGRNKIIEYQMESL